MHELEKLLAQTLEDQIFTREERKELRKFVKENPMPTNALGAIRSRIFEMVEARLEDHKSRRLLAWLKEANKIVLPKNTSQLRQRVLFSPGDDCRNAIIDHMRRCQNTMDICVFTISDDRIVKEIQNSHRRGVRVRIISDDEKMFDRGNDIKRLAKFGVPVKIDMAPDHMHHKFTIFDQHYTLTGSYNWTRSAAERNEENILITNDPKTIEAFQKKFNELWEQFDAV